MTEPRRPYGKTVAHINASIPIPLEQILRNQITEQRRTISSIVSEGLELFAEKYGLQVPEPDKR